jgi:hypothetical protein
MNADEYKAKERLEALIASLETLIRRDRSKK